ncbi:hypothetical protein P692DRAFT_201862362 [Suillus brevipes Sb2]|nr:hypothetical protein P692DRAFT_201862362 [Suillus brevipes Sb2]
MITVENTNASTDNRSSDGRKQSPPAFLDLADSAARLGTNMPDMSARVELKRLEHERQRLLQRKMFEDQMRALEQQQAQELLSIPYDPTASAHLAVSAPTTPPRVNAVLNGDNLVRAAQHEYRPLGADLGPRTGQLGSLRTRTTGRTPQRRGGGSHHHLFSYPLLQSQFQPNHCHAASNGLEFGSPCAPSKLLTPTLATRSRSRRLLHH